MPENAVIFDMDGLLLDTERLCRDAFVAAGCELGLPDLNDLFLQCIGMRMAESNEIVRAGLGDGADFDRFIALWRSKNDVLHQTGIPLKPGARDLLVHLKNTGIPTAVATSTNTPSATAHLTRVGLAGYFDHIVGGNQVTQGKPAPDIYLLAADRLGVSPNNCFAFEDSDPGTRAAVTSGATTIQIPDLKPPAPDIAELGHHIATDLLSGARLVGLMPAKTTGPVPL